MYKKSLLPILLLSGSLIGNNPLSAQSACPSPTGVAASPTTVCIGSPVTLSATLPSGTTTINWYTTSTGGTPIATTSSSSTTYTPPSPGTYTFYAEATGAGGGSTVNNFSYTGAVQTLTLQPGSYLIECWGGNGYTQTAGYNGKGGYASGTLTLTAAQTMYIYVGGVGTYPTGGVSANTWTFNGGGTGYPNNNASYGHGGGASDVRTVGGAWDDATSLASRVIVAGGGGAGRNSSYIGGNGGGLTGGTGTYFSPDQAGGPTGGSQTAGGTNTPWTGLTLATLGKAMTWNGSTLSANFLAGGGGGYYGGASGRVAGGGGSSYIGGVTSGATIMYGQTGFVANPDATGNGYVRITGQTSCTPGPRVATAAVFVSDTPDVDLGIDIAVCRDVTNSVTLDAGNPGYSFRWDDNSVNQTRNVTQSGTYYVKVTNNHGCSSSDTINVTFNLSPVVNLGADTTICPGTPLVLNAGNPGATYLWDDNSTGNTRSTTVNGTYYVSVTNSFNCSAYDTINIAYFPVSNPALGPDTSICMQETILLNPGAFREYLWHDGNSSRTYLVTDAGSYSVRIKDYNGCYAYDTILVSIIPKAQTGGFSFIPYFYEQLGKVQFAAINPVNVTGYHWDFGDGNFSTQPSPLHTYASQGYYNVKLVVSEDRCGSALYDQIINIEYKETGIDEFAKGIKVKVYPNPANSDLYISFDDDRIIVQELHIFDALGRRHDIPYTQNGKVLELSSILLSSGVYSANIITNKGALNTKFEILK